MTNQTSTFAILNLDLSTISRVMDMTDAKRDEMAREYGARLVYLPMGGEVGDEVEVNDDGEARVVITTEQIKALRNEAAEAGDLDQIDICDRALAGNAAARAECERVIRDAQAQQ